MRSTAVVIPCYNEEERLELETYREFLDLVPNVELLLVDDGSTDDTLTVLRVLAQTHPSRCRVLALDQNQGKAEAVRRGILNALSGSADYVGYWDADLATPLTTIPQFITVLDSRPTIDLVMGSRVKLLGREIERSPVRHYAGRVFATAVAIVLGLPVYDSQCGAKLFRVNRGIRKLFAEPFISPWIFDVEILARDSLRRERLKMTPVEDATYEFPLLEWRDKAGSKVGLADFLRAIPELGRIHYRYRC